MDLSPRDRAIVAVVARFKQLSSSHIQELVFPTSLSRTSFDRALKRLVARGYLARVDRFRLVDSSRGGSGTFIYQLGRQATEYYEGVYQLRRNIDSHRLAIADAYLEMKRAHDRGELVIHGMSTEPDCWLRVGGYDIRPDLLLDIEQRSGSRRWIWLEVDMGSERPQRIKEKLTLYWQAAQYNAYEREQGSETALKRFPPVIWVAVDEARDREIKWLVGQEPAAAQKLFRITTVDKLAGLFA